MAGTAPLAYPYTNEEAVEAGEAITVDFATRLAQEVNHLYYRLTGDTYSGAISPAGGLTAHDHSGTPDGHPMPRTLAWRRHDQRQRSGNAQRAIFNLNWAGLLADEWISASGPTDYALATWGSLLVSPGIEKVSGAFVYSLAVSGASAISPELYLVGRLRKTSGTEQVSAEFTLPVNSLETPPLTVSTVDLSNFAVTGQESQYLLGVNLAASIGVAVDGATLNDLVLEFKAPRQELFQLSIWGYTLFELPVTCAPAGTTGGFIVDDGTGTYPGAGEVEETPI